MKKSRLYYYPKGDGSNDYLNSCRRIWSYCGFESKPLGGFRENFFNIRNREELLILNWFEDRIGGSKRPYMALLKSILLMIVLRLRFRKIVWVRHNYYPHSKFKIKHHILLVRLLRRISDVALVHRHGLSKDFRYASHPLYSSESVQTKNRDRDIDFLYFGAVKGYKGLVELLEDWPVEKSLCMLGRSDDLSLTKHIGEVINKRKLDVTWQNSFIEYDQLCHYIARSKYVVLPHNPNTMIVTGAFYHAISFGASVLMRRGAMYTEYFSKFRGVYDLDDFLLNKSLSNGPGIVDPMDYFCDESVAERWRLALESA
ncbi:MULTISPECIES: hypothetical protein [Thalassolituus]|jgi:hypothetical protein|uniref:hypothetical protein n=1 Tax=Thalassolituus TaxID=187492 RepID=UPI002625B0F7|nr:MULTISPECIES: hypothetical protein [Thalassolituus]|tara:strand:- start:2205 stop:3146 length:942 start_codon:yes stop_codon:yes gene_type:complete